jgi:hypothetical protein
MRGERAGFERLLSVMPEGWKGKAKELGALARGREIKNAVDLLRLVFIFADDGGPAKNRGPGIYRYVIFNRWMPPGFFQRLPPSGNPHIKTITIPIKRAAAQQRQENSRAPGGKRTSLSQNYLTVY